MIVILIFNKKGGMFFFLAVIEGFANVIGETAKPSPPPYPLAGATLPASSSFSIGPVHLASYDHANIPYPRTSGARFGRDGVTLICFGRTKSATNKTTPTPRSLAYFDGDSGVSEVPNQPKEPLSRKQSTLVGPK